MDLTIRMKTKLFDEDGYSVSVTCNEYADHILAAARFDCISDSIEFIYNQLKDMEWDYLELEDVFGLSETFFDYYEEIYPKIDPNSYYPGNIIDKGILTKLLPTFPSGKYVYVIEAMGTNRVKIGYTKDPKRRYYDLNHASAVNLKVLYLIKVTTKKAEKVVHNLFADDRIKGEWFSKSKRLLDFIKILNKKRFVPRGVKAIKGLIKEVDDIL